MFEKPLELKPTEPKKESFKDEAKKMLERFCMKVGIVSAAKISADSTESISKAKEIRAERESKKEIFPDDAGRIKTTEYLGGSSDVRAGYFNEELLVVKKARRNFDAKSEAEQFNTEQLIDEYIADKIYETCGLGIPASKVYKNGQYKISKFIPGKDLNTFPKDQPEFLKIKEELQKGFVLDCLLANWDVTGAANDNIRLGNDGIVYRLDNGGALRFRARGGKKETSFGEKVEELKSLRERNELFRDISKEQINVQIGEILKKQDAILATVDAAVDALKIPPENCAELKLTLTKRLEYLRNFAENYKKGTKQAKEKKTDKWIYESIVTNNYFDDWDEELQLEGNDGIKNTIKENIMQAEKRKQHIYESFASNLNITVEEFKTMLQEKVENMVQQSEFFVATETCILDKVLNIDARYKSQFETNTSKGSPDTAFRAVKEVEMFGFNKEEALKVEDIQASDAKAKTARKVLAEKNKEKRPIYGYFSDDEHGGLNGSNGKIPPPTNTRQYGGINVKIKKENALKKATVVFHDSLGSDAVPTPATKPHFTSFYLPNPYNAEYIIKNLERTSIVNWGASYTEVQYHDQLTVDDIESIHISRGNSLSSDEIEQIRGIFIMYKLIHPESTIQLIEF